MTSKEYEKAKNFQFQSYEEVKRVIHIAYSQEISPYEYEYVMREKQLKQAEESKNIEQAKVSAALQEYSCEDA